VFEALQSFLRESDMRLPVRERKNHTQHDVIATGGKAHNLPSPREFFGKRANWQVLDEHSEQSFIQVVRQFKFFTAPTGREPRFRPGWLAARWKATSPPLPICLFA
jgi:hypothetical protein